MTTVLRIVLDPCVSAYNGNDHPKNPAVKSAD